MFHKKEVKLHEATGIYRETGQWFFYKKGLAHLEFHLSTKQCSEDFLEIIKKAKEDIEIVIKSLK